MRVGLSVAHPPGYRMASKREVRVEYVVVAVVLLVVLIAFVAPLPGRGPGSIRRHPWTVYKLQLRDRVLERAGGRCEAPLFLAWGRCANEATEGSHVYPYARGGPTFLSNAQALCARHFRRRSRMRPPWWYLLTLENRRRGYFPEGEEVRVYARMADERRTFREAWAERMSGR